MASGKPLSALALAGALCVCACSNFVTEAHPQAGSAQPPLQFVGQWGTKGEGPGQLGDPASIATDKVGNVYIADEGTQFIHKFGPEGTPLLAFQEGGLNHPQWIALDRGGAMYVSDPTRNLVYIFLPDAKRYRILHLRTRPSAENEISVAIGADGMIHVLDPNADHVFTYSPRMRLIRRWRPSEEAPDASRHLGPLAIGPAGDLYIADASQGKILRFSPAGHLESSYVVGGDDPPKRLSREFAVSNNSVFAMDPNGATLYVWSLDGKPKLDIDLSAELGHESRVPPALAVSPRGELLVLDAPADRVLRYRINF